MFIAQIFEKLIQLIFFERKQFINRIDLKLLKGSIVHQRRQAMSDRVSDNPVNGFCLKSHFGLRKYFVDGVEIGFGRGNENIFAGTVSDYFFIFEFHFDGDFA